ncbi:PAQR family membrane homeostasis protein TrhA [Limosilactobacillus caecicola]|uniref:PAQR family membrane homeostasis protein TrhA n=1 Tax=Limosilactobacillus caecicola TaxID=2941332 RepID=UPI00203D12EF|nr:hemolysin III family protein [Limosilactobacillus caecicola]
MKQPTDEHKDIFIEVMNAITHGIGALLSIAGLVLLIIMGVHRGGALRIVSFTIMGSVMILFYLSSTLFHSLIYTRAKAVFQRLDHCFIYVLIAASYTPFCLVAIRGWLGWTLFGIEWGMVILGIIYKSIWLEHKSNLSTLIYVIMGWLCIVAFGPLWNHLGPVGFSLLLAGGLTYTIGAIIYSFPRRTAHLVWHFFVLAGSALIYFSVLFFV